MKSDEESGVAVNEEYAPRLEQRAKGEEELADNLAAEIGDYTLSDYLKPSRDDIGSFTVGAAIGGAAMYAANFDDKAAAGVVAGGALADYFVERWDERELGAKAAENSLERWKERFSISGRSLSGEEYKEDPESEFGVWDDESSDLLEE